MLVQGIVVEIRARRILVGIGEEVIRRIERLRHLVVGKDRKGDDLSLRVRRVIHPVVLTRCAVAHEIGRAPHDRAILQILSEWELGAREVAEISIHVGIGPVLRAEGEAFQARHKILEVLGAVPEAEGL